LHGTSQHHPIVASEAEATPSGKGGATTRDWSPCELVWAKITNADLAGDREREAELKAQASELRCFSRPATIPHQEYPEVEDFPDP
jgi:hypothetical protein